MLIVTIAYALIRYIHIRNFFLKALMVYVPTMLLVFLYVLLRGLTVELAGSAYRDVFINYSIGFVAVTVIVLIISKVKKKKTAAGQA